MTYGPFRKEEPMRSYSGVSSGLTLTIRRAILAALRTCRRNRLADFIAQAKTQSEAEAKATATEKRICRKNVRQSVRHRMGNG